MGMISPEDKAYLLSLKPEDLTFSLLRELLSNKINASQSLTQTIKSRFDPTDTLALAPNEYINKDAITTTVGRFIYNKYLIERHGFQDVLGYVNYALTDGSNSKLENTLSEALINGKITIQAFQSYISARDNLGMQMNFSLAASLTAKTITILPEIKKDRDMLFKKYDKELANGDIEIAEKIEKELISKSKELLKGDPGLSLYNSEARASFENYKNMFLFKGATKNNLTGKYEIVKSSFSDGIRKEDIPIFATSITSGAYPKAVGTQESGYMAKQILAAMQTEVLGEKDSDCGTKKYVDQILSAGDAKNLEYRYILEGSSLVCLTPDIIGKYVGKRIKLRSPMYCLADNICNKCAGDMNYKLDMINIGLGCSRVATTLLKMGMKQFHVSNLKSNKINVDDMLI